MRDQLHRWFTSAGQRTNLAVAFAFALVVIGVSLFALSYVPGVGAKVSDALRSIGGIILAGGTFSAIVKGIQYAGVFQDELARVIFSEHGLRRRADLNEIWLTATNLLHPDPFPQIRDRVRSWVIERIFQNQGDHYFEDAVHTYMISFENSMDKRRNIVTIEHHFQALIVPRKDVKLIEWNPKFVGSAPSPENSAEPIQYLTLQSPGHATGIIETRTADV